MVFCCYKSGDLSPDEAEGLLNSFSGCKENIAAAITPESQSLQHVSVLSAILIPLTASPR